MGHWHMYYTGVKCTSYAGFGLTEGQILVIISLFATSILGQDFWTDTVKVATLIPVIGVELFMSLFALVDTMKYQCSISRVARLHELFPLAQFIGLSYFMTYTIFYIKYPALAMFAMSLIFYLQNGKLVLASVTETKMALIHLELLFLWLPLIPYILQCRGIISKEDGEYFQIRCGFVFVFLIVERTITCSVVLVSQVTQYLGYGFFDVPKPMINDGKKE